ncbi:MAG: hypothetical protein ACM3OB_06105, partial [Acidobacteriota bacterium]
PMAADAKPFELEIDLDLELEAEEAAAEALPAPPAPPAMPAMTAPVPTAAGLDSEAPIEIQWDFDLGEPPPAPSPGLAELPVTPQPLELDVAALERTAAEVHRPAAPRDEDLVAEAEVFAKYGLKEKAQDRLREVLQRNPQHLGALAQSIALLLEQGRQDRVLQLARQMASAAATAGNDEPWRHTLARLQKAGYRVGDGEVLEAPPARRKAKSDRITDLLGSLADTGSAKPIPAAPRPAAAARPKGPSAIDQALAGIASQVLRPEKPHKAPPPAPPVAPPVAPAPTASIPPAPPAGAELQPFELHLEEELPEVVLPGEGSAAGAPPSDLALSWLAEPAAAAPQAGEEKLFDDEQDFFDLAAELEKELIQDEGSPAEPLGVAPQQDQSLEEIVEGFKKGVAENLSPEDYDTHFNLGIAYREMGLLDEAIGEFQLASKDLNNLVECCSMLGICFLDKGLPELAIKWYRRGLETPSLSEERQLGLLYDLGNAYALAGDVESAYKTFVEIYGVNSNYRDVVARLEELGRR